MALDPLHTGRSRAPPAPWLEADESLPCMKCAYHCNSGERADAVDRTALALCVRPSNVGTNAAPSALPLSAPRSLRVSRRVEVLQRGASRELSLLITSAPGPAPSRRRLYYRHSEAAGDGLR